MTWGCLNFNKTWICECTVPLNSTAYINKLILHKLFSLDDNCASDHESSISSEQICFVWRGLCACERQDHITQISLLRRTATLTLLVTVSICFSFIPLIPGWVNVPCDWLQLEPLWLVSLSRWRNNRIVLQWFTDQHTFQFYKSGLYKW